MLANAMRKSSMRLMSVYANRMRAAWTQDPSVVHPDWDRYFRTRAAHAQPAAPNTDHITQQDLRFKQLTLSAYFLIRYFRQRGHELATLDPLNLKNYEQFGKIYLKNPLEVDLRKNKILVQSDYNVPFKLPRDPIFLKQFSGFLQEKQQWTLHQIHTRLKQIYCGKVGLQSMHLVNDQEKQWLMTKMQQLSVHKYSKQEKIKILESLTDIESFNFFLNDKLKTSKRFGVQGLCSMVSGLNSMVAEASKRGVEYIGFGMAHRGRLSALVNVFNKPFQKIFAQFQEASDKQGEQSNWGNSGDVKYHLGATVQKKIDDRNIRLSILPNPSHLETVNPVCMGHVKAVADSRKDHGDQGKKVMSVLIHGDAAVAGQGIVYECLQMGYLNHYANHGVIHIVANNQIGFTTTPAEARTGLYCTDVAKSIQAPIIHVNADEPQLVNEVMKIAIEYRETFKKDIFIDIIGYRRYGHNQQDQPTFTQPMMYRQIAQRPNIYTIYKNKLVSQNVVSEQQAKNMWDDRINKISEAYNESRNQSFDIKKWQIPSYHRVVDFARLGEIKKTGLQEAQLKQIGMKITKIPDSFTAHASIQKIYEARQKAIETGLGIDFALAQGLAFGSLLAEGFNIRLSGQDVERGTFSHRHAVIVDQNKESKYMPLQSLVAAEPNRVQIQNSFLSEYAALGFEYGYSMTNPNCLTIWEAQFGDFSNGGQIIIDNYLSSGEAKWKVQNGLILNLPHGMDGQGPEHSSARPERYLQMVSEPWVTIASQRANGSYKPMKHTNMHIICVSNAANLFHAYRRQLRRDYRKPLINLVSKKLLKLRDAQSPLADFQRDRFLCVIGQCDEQIKPEQVQKVVICCGQAYYSVLQKRKTQNRKDMAIVRIEQLAPFHFDDFKQQVSKFKNAKQFIWFQEQHRNSGAWNYLAPRLNFILDEIKNEGKISNYQLSCVSRRNSAAPAVGKKKMHDQQNNMILEELFNGGN